MGSGLTKAVGWTRAALAFAVPDAGERATLLDGVGIRPEAFAHPENRIAVELDHRVWLELDRRFGRPLGLELARQNMRPSVVGLLGFLAMAAPTVGDALDLSVRYHRLLEDHPSVSLRVHEGARTVVFAPGVDPCALAAVDAALAGHLSMIRAWSGHPVNAAAFHVRGPRPEHAEALGAWLGCAVEAEAEHNAITIASVDCARPLHTANVELQAYLETLAHERLAAPLEHDPLPRKIRDEVQRRFGNASLELADVARSLGYSARTLQRRLGELDLRYAQLVDQVRFRQASTMLAESTLSIGEVAYALGYRDARGFRRAFRRWAGVSPQAYRNGQIDHGSLGQAARDDATG